MALPRVLCVDDEPQILEGLGRVLRKKVELSTSAGPEAALARLDAGETFEVVVSDMRMPGMNGAALLARFHQRAPDTTRLLLTGYAELDAAVAAVNEGHVFRFLTKPCPPDVLIPALEAAVAQHRLVTAERVLLEQTLVGSVRALIEALALARPEAFRDLTRRHERARAIAEHLKIPDAWHVEVASMIACVGYVVLPAEVVAKLHAGAPLDAAEREMVDRLPEVSERVLSHIPRLELVRAVLEHDGRSRGSKGKDIPIGAAILGAVRDLAAAEAREGDTLRALAHVKAHGEGHDPAVIAAMLEVCQPAEPELRSLTLGELRTGMLLAADVKARSGLLLVARGQRVTTPLLERLRNFGVRVGIVEPIVCEVERALSPR
jgi:response regulator RpfG family c-di-GMP phosphodiesterase